MPAGFNLGSKDGAASHGPYSASQELYEKIDGGNTATLKILSFDVQHMATEDPEYVTESVLGEYRYFYSEGFEDLYIYSDPPLNVTIDGKAGKLKNFTDSRDAEYPLKGEIIAINQGDGNLVILHFTDYVKHYDKGNIDLEANKKSGISLK